MKVLVIDDDWIIVRAVQGLLEEHGHEVIGCGDPLDAIDKCEREQMMSAKKIDAFISDYMMPGFSGLELLEIIRQKFPEIRRILLTAAPKEPEVQDALRSGLVQVLVEKPWGRGELRRAIS